MFSPRITAAARQPHIDARLCFGGKNFPLHSLFAVDEDPTLPPTGLNALALAPHLTRCGYDVALRATNYDFGGGSVPLATFSDTPHDSRSICIASLNIL